MTTPEQLADGWIDYARRLNGSPPDYDLGDGFALQWAADDQPSLCWRGIRCVVARYTLDQLNYLGEKNEAQSAVGQLAASVIEDLLGHHGSDFIELVEEEAKNDRRFAWALGGVAQFTMSDEIFERVQRAAGEQEYWRRRIF